MGKKLTSIVLSSIAGTIITGWAAYNFMFKPFNYTQKTVTINTYEVYKSFREYNTQKHINYLKGNVVYNISVSNDLSKVIILKSNGNRKEKEIVNAKYPIDGIAINNSKEDRGLELVIFSYNKGNVYLSNINLDR